MQLLEHDQFGPLSCQLANTRFALGQAAGFIGPGLLLDQADFQDAGHVETPCCMTVFRLPWGSCMVRQCKLPCWRITLEQSIGTMSRPGNASPRAISARVSAASP